MSKRLQVLIPEALEAAIHKAAKRSRLSKGAWVRRAIESALRAEREASSRGAVDRLAAVDAPSADIDQMLAEIERGRGGAEESRGDARRAAGRG
jgi:hypothetical protein